MSRVRTAVIAVVIATVTGSTMAAILAVGSVSADSTATSPAVQIAQPSNATAAPASFVSGLSCLAIGTCEAAGGYKPSSGPGGDEPLTATQTNGAFATPTEQLPGIGDADMSSSAAAELYAIQCFTPGSCVAVGFYKDTGANEQALFGSSTNDTWNFQKVASPSDPTGGIPQNADLINLSCPTTTTCVAVGVYEDTNNIERAMVTTMTNSGGSWSPSTTEINAPGDAEPGTNGLANLDGVSCPSVTSCVAVGQYEQNDTNLDAEPFVATDNNGSWTSQTVPPPTGPTNGDPQAAYLGSISCTDPTACVGVGTYIDSGNNVQPLVATEINGAWTAQGIDLPQGGSNGALNSVACWASRSCIAVGNYDTTGGTAPLVASASAGTWSVGSSVNPPSLANYAILSAVSCPSSGECTAVGSFGSSQSQAQLMSINLAPTLAVATPSLGQASVETPYASQLNAIGGSGNYSWTLTSSLPAGLSLSSNGAISGTPSSVGTTSFGIRVDDHGPLGQSATAQLSLTVSARLPIRPTAPQVACSNGTAKVSAQIVSDTGGSPITSFTTSASPGGRSVTSASGSIAFRNLSDGKSYTFTVTESNVAGASSTSPSSRRVWCESTPSRARILRHSQASLTLIGHTSVKAGSKIYVEVLPPASPRFMKATRTNGDRYYYWKTGKLPPGKTTVHFFFKKKVIKTTTITVTLPKKRTHKFIAT